MNVWPESGCGSNWGSAPCPQTARSKIATDKNTPLRHREFSPRLRHVEKVVLLLILSPHGGPIGVETKVSIGVEPSSIGGDPRFTDITFTLIFQ
jgi:hypothetical protein